MIKTIAFDIGNVLSLEKKSSFNISKKFGIDKEKWYKKVKPIIMESMKGKLTKEQTLRKISKEQGNTLSKKELKKRFRRLSESGFTPNKQLIKITKNLQKKGYKIITISNAWCMIKDVFANYNDLRHFNLKIFSCDIKSYKPQLKIFKIALKKSKTKPSEMLFIDNLEKNTLAAEKVGIKTILFRNNKQIKRNLTKILEKIK